MTQISTPQITPLARRLAEDSGVLWHTLAGEDGSAITERDVLEHLTQVIANTLPASVPVTSILPPGQPAATPPAFAPPAPVPEEAETVDFGLLAESLSKVLEELLATEEVEVPSISAPVADSKRAPATSASASPGAQQNLQHSQMLLADEKRAHAETQRQLDALRESSARQKARAEQLKPLSAEIRRLGSALGVANAEMERLYPLEAQVASLQKQLEETRTDEARVRLLCRELQERQEWLEQELQQSPRWQFWRRASQE